MHLLGPKSRMVEDSERFLELNVIEDTTVRPSSSESLVTWQTKSEYGPWMKGKANEPAKTWARRISFERDDG